jgi:hypothetical protein
MKQAIAGVAPVELGEVTIMTVWPSMAQWPLGRMIGRICRTRPVWLGRVLALATIPLALVLFFVRILPPPVPGYFNRRFRLTNRRLIEVQDRLSARALRPAGVPVFPWPRFTYNHAVRDVELDRFDAIDVVVLPGQEWYPAGDLVFRLGSTETFRIRGVQRPETFRQTCLKAHQAFVLVKRATAHQRKAS